MNKALANEGDIIIPSFISAWIILLLLALFWPPMSNDLVLISVSVAVMLVPISLLVRAESMKPEKYPEIDSNLKLERFSLNFLEFLAVAFGLPLFGLIGLVPCIISNPHYQIREKIFVAAAEIICLLGVAAFGISAEKYEKYLKNKANAAVNPLK